MAYCETAESEQLESSSQETQTEYKTLYTDKPWMFSKHGDNTVNIFDEEQNYDFLSTFLFSTPSDDRVKERWPIIDEFAQQCASQPNINPLAIRFLQQRYG